MLKIAFLLLLPLWLISASVVVPDDPYNISDSDDLSYVYSEEYRRLLPSIKNYQERLIEGYEKEYGFSLDDRLYVGLASKKNQIANGFSTQIPFNSQLFYGAGAVYIDYFCFSSWLKTLLIHETAHNFQLNPKENRVSRLSHKILGNTPLSFLGLFPLFPIPNLLESSFILEGNAVLNESRFANGGRLFSGYALAELVTLAQHNEITPELMYNQTLEFPYNEKFYLVGGFFQQFLVRRYGIKKVNGYFKTFSQQLLPFFANNVFEEQFGENFETLLAQFVEEVKEKYRSFQPSKGKILAKSQLFVPLNQDETEIYTLVGDRRSAPKVLRLNRENQTLDFKEGSWRVGEVFKKKEIFYTQSSGKTSPLSIEMGLFDQEGYLLEGTSSKAIQGFTRDGKPVYFDVEGSLETPQVYIDQVFYSESHSSVYLDSQDNLYYFKQEGETRTLYKNRTALYSYEGHYGFVTDVGRGGEVYFVASSKNGSTVYLLENKKLKRVTLGDDVIEFKLLNSREAFIVTIGAEGYSYRIIESKKIRSEKPYLAKVFTESWLTKDQEESNFKFLKEKKELNSRVYQPLTELKYSSLDQALFYDIYEGVGLNLQANFSDPLFQNRLALLLSHTQDRDLVGVKYANVAHQVEYGTALYGVNHEDSSPILERNHGIDAYLKYPFLAEGYYRGSMGLSYTRSYENIFREPITWELNLVNQKQFALSKYANDLNALSLFGTRDRESSIVGVAYEGVRDMPWQNYFGFGFRYLKSDMVNPLEEKGVELRNSLSALQSDRATLNAPSFSENLYAKELMMFEASWRKVMDFSYYSFTVPLSLQRQSYYLKQRIYDVQLAENIEKRYRETTLGVESDLLFFHQLVLPVSLEWIYNPDILDKNQLRFLFGKSF